MFIDKLKLVNYRNLESVNINFCKNINFLIGVNGQGKTNILESIFLLGHGESFRYSSNSSLINFNQKEAMVNGVAVEEKGISYDLACKIGKSQKIHYFQNKKLSLQSMNHRLKMVLFSPESLSVIKEGAEYRRDTVDEFLLNSDNDYWQELAHFRKVLKTRNKILKELSINGEKSNQPDLLLEAINPSFLQAASLITFKRINALAKLLPFYEEAAQYIARRSIKLGFQYLISDVDFISKEKEEIIMAIKTRMQQLYSAEIATGTSLVGPQKHQIVFLYNQNDSRFYCSQGQQRSLILALKIAQIVYHHKAFGYFPILLLDDVLSELDENKKSALVEFLNTLNAQVFITSTDYFLPKSFSNQESKILQVSDGRIDAEG